MNSLRVSLPVPWLAAHTPVAENLTHSAATAPSEPLRSDGEITSCETYANVPWEEIEIMPFQGTAPVRIPWPTTLPPPRLEQTRPARRHRETISERLRRDISRFGSSRQDGDWNCGACGHTNWRRRKVCQTCFPCMHSPSCPLCIFGR